MRLLPLPVYLPRPCFPPVMCEIVIQHSLTARLGTLRGVSNLFTFSVHDDSVSIVGLSTVLELNCDVLCPHLQYDKTKRIIYSSSSWHTVSPKIAIDEGILCQFTRYFHDYFAITKKKKKKYALGHTTRTLHAPCSSNHVQVTLHTLVKYTKYNQTLHYITLGYIVHMEITPRPQYS